MSTTNMKVTIEKRVLNAYISSLRRHKWASVVIITVSAVVMVLGIATIVCSGTRQDVCKINRRAHKTVDTTYGIARQTVYDHIAFRNAFKRQDGSYSTGEPIISDRQLSDEIARLERFTEKRNALKAMKSVFNLNCNLQSMIYDGSLGGTPLTYEDLISIEHKFYGRRLEFWILLSLACFIIVVSSGLGVLVVVDRVRMNGGGQETF